MVSIILDTGIISITLPTDLFWENELAWTDVEGSFERTLGGSLLVWNSIVLKGRPFDLVATDQRGWFTREMVEQLNASTFRITTMTLTLTYTKRVSGSPVVTPFTVMWRFNEKPVIDVQPLIASRVEHTRDDYYTGTLKLIEVGQTAS